MEATFTKLRTGAWGLRIKGSAKAGEAVTVRKKSGEVSQETIGAVVWSGDGVTLATIASTAPSGNGGGQRRTSRNWRPCGYPGCNTQYCDECDGEGYRHGR